MISKHTAHYNEIDVTRKRLHTFHISLEMCTNGDSIMSWIHLMLARFHHRKNKIDSEGYAVESWSMTFLNYKSHGAL